LPPTGDLPLPDNAEDWPALMAAAQDGDAAAYRRLLRALAPVLRRMVRRRVAPQMVEDVVQDVLLTVHRVRHTYDPARPFLPWLAAIAQRRGIDSQRRHGRIAAYETADPEAIETFPDDSANNRDAAHALSAEESRDALTRAVAQLPAKQKKAIELIKLREMSVSEAAAASGQTPGAIRVNTHRAIAALRVLLGRGGE
jgi:RNA polymerase sigma factor (sigma-70 family)